MRKPKFAPVRFRFWGSPRITKVVERGGWVRHNLVITARVCWKVVDLLVGGVYIPKDNTAVTPQDVIEGKPVLARVLITHPKEGTSLARIEALATVPEPKHDIIIAPVRPMIIDNGNKCIQKIRTETPPQNVTMIKPHPRTRVAIITLPTNTKTHVRFDYHLHQTIIWREETPIT